MVNRGREGGGEAREGLAMRKTPPFWPHKQTAALRAAYRRAAAAATSTITATRARDKSREESREESKIGTIQRVWPTSHRTRDEGGKGTG